MGLMQSSDEIARGKVRPASSIHEPGRKVLAASSIVKTAIERVADIERRRRAQGWSQNELLRRAAVDRGGWMEIRRGTREPRAETLDRLESALGAAPAKRPPQIILGFHRLVMAQLCRHLKLPIGNVLAEDLSVQRPRDPAWLQSARISRMAIYITAVELELENADLARAIGCTRQNVKQARDAVFDWIEQDKKICRAVESVAALVARRLR